MLVRATSSCWSAIGLIELAFGFPVITLNGRACGGPLCTIILLGLLLLLHLHDHVLVHVELLDGFLIQRLLDVVLEMARVLLLQDCHAVLR
jgi:hypothetical protein